MSWEGAKISERVRALHQAVLETAPAVCAERAVLVTRFHKTRRRRTEPALLRQARALEHVLRHKVPHIYPLERLVGGFTQHRVGGGIFPELHGVPVLEDLWRFERRLVNPLTVTPRERRQLLLEVLPYWAPRFLALGIRPRHRAVRFVADQLAPVRYLLNETAGISHFVPYYEELVQRGTIGYRAEAKRRLATVAPDSEDAVFLRAVPIVCAGLEELAAGYSDLAARLAADETDPARRAELEEIAAICKRVPRHPASTLHEALQAILFVQIALNLESLDNSISPGRLDQVLQPFYAADVAEARLDAAGAMELLGCFAVKLCELVPVFSERITRFHGGLFNGQVIVVGGVDREGSDATCDMTYLMLSLMDQLRTRQPNWHARLHPGSPPTYRRLVARALASGAASPALYNDEVIVPALTARGIAVEDARDYATVGCVEPVAAGRSYLSTDAALVNLPLCLELALNQGRRFGSLRRIGAGTTPAERCVSAEMLIGLLRRQIAKLVVDLIVDLHGVEDANLRRHPTPLTSLLIDGCLESMRDASAGGARYNGSGVQGVGVVDVGDSLAAIDAVVFCGGHATMTELIAACNADFVGFDALRARLRDAPKYGNDNPVADGFVGRVMSLFSKVLGGRTSLRGGAYVPGYYSVTSHVAFGEVVGALPNGRRAGEPFSSGISPASGQAKAGPTAALLSAARLPLALAPNGVNHNLELGPWALAGEAGVQRVGALVDGAMAAGCMQLQINALDPEILLDARDHPGRYPGLLVRVSGYSAYFDDLSPRMKQEIIERTLHA